MLMQKSPLLLLPLTLVPLVLLLHLLLPMSRALCPSSWIVIIIYYGALSLNLCFSVMISWDSLTAPTSAQRNTNETKIRIIPPPLILSFKLGFDKIRISLVGYMRHFLSTSYLKLLVCKTSWDVWTTIEQHFASLSSVYIIKLKRQLQNLPKGNLSITDYLLKHKTIVDELAVVGHLVDESDQVTHI